MKSLLNTDKYTKLHYNRQTGKDERQWIMYGDDTVEPVRRDQPVSRKYNADKRTVDWFVMQKPRDWDPVREGFNVSLNHDYGQEDKPGSPPKTKPVTTERSPGKSRNLDFKIGRDNPGEPVARYQTTLGKGPDGYRKLEQKEQVATPKPRNSANDAREMENRLTENETKEYYQWLDTMQNNPPWGKKKTSAERYKA